MHASTVRPGGSAVSNAGDRTSGASGSGLGSLAQRRKITDAGETNTGNHSTVPTSPLLREAGRAGKGSDEDYKKTGVELHESTDGQGTICTQYRNTSNNKRNNPFGTTALAPISRARTRFNIQPKKRCHSNGHRYVQNEPRWW